MSNTRFTRTALTVALPLALMAGCGVDLDSSLVGPLREVSLPASEQVNEDLLDPDASNKLVNSSRESWSAPFPQRKNAFVYPGSSVEAVDTQKTDSSLTSSVSVVGFANVDRPVVLLKVRDQTRTLGVDDKHGSIQVTAITPPRVTLKMANLVWTISMFDKSNAK